MRVTQSQANRAQLLETRQKKVASSKAARIATSGKRIERPSDDPTGSRRALLARAAAEDYAIGRAKINHAGAEQQRREGALAHMTSALSRARDVALSVSNGTISAAQRATAASEITQIKETMIELGNTKFLDRYLFAGSQTNTAAFTALGAYAGDATQINVALPGGIAAPITSDGGALLRGTGGAQDVIGALDSLIVGLQANTLPVIRTGLDELAASIDHVVDSRAELGADVGLLESLDAVFQTAEMDIEQQRVQIEDVDIVEAYSAVVRTRQAYESALQVITQSRTPSIFELL